MSNFSSESEASYPFDPFYERFQNARALLSSIHELLDENPSEEAMTRADGVLDAIGKIGVAGVVRIAVETVDAYNSVFEPADPVEVRDYVKNISSWPPIVIRDIGSIDEELITSLGLNK